MTLRHITAPDGTRLALEVRGQGPAVVVVGGAMNDRATHRELSELLAAHHTVVDYDRRGRGDSGDSRPYAVEREVEDLAAVVDAAGGSAMAYGVSSGAVLILEAAAGGVPLRKLALFEPPFRVGGAVPQVPPSARTDLEALVAEGRRGDAVEYFVTRVVGLPPQAVAQMRGSPMWPPLEALAPTLAYDLRIMGDSSLARDRLARVDAPVLVLASAASAPWLQAAARAVADALPAARLRILEGTFHQVPPNVLAAALREFFDA